MSKTRVTLQKLDFQPAQSSPFVSSLARFEEITLKKTQSLHFMHLDLGLPKPLLITN
ncbi:hypothetical protein WAF17_20235 [Bernardetia sp. ABR2-2B]|uniref:hypothetical protein n=1 Tax=Bernardetia sp. ABR2-2B TaxID=3127472 RepID=UPI0030D2A20F